MKGTIKLLALLPLLASCSGSTIIEVCPGYSINEKFDVAYCDHYLAEKDIDKDKYKKISSLSVSAENKIIYTPNYTIHTHYFYVERK